MRRSATAILLVVAALSLTGCGSGTEAAVQITDRPLTDADREMDALYDKAVQTGKTTVVVYAPSAGVLGTVADEFTKRYPKIDVELVRIFGADLSSRVKAEAQTGKHEADVVLSVINADIMVPSTEGLYEQFTPKGSENVVTGDWGGSEKFFRAPFSAVTGISYSTKEITAAEAPKTVADLLDPKWQGRIGISDPTTAGLASVYFRDLAYTGQIDEQWMTSLAAQKPRIFSQAPEIDSALATGEISVAVDGLSFVASSKAKGAPVEFLPETAIMSPTAGALVKGAPHPDAAKLFLTWTYSPEAQRTFSSVGLYPLVKGAPLPAGFTADKPEVNSYPGAEDGTALLGKVITQWKSLAQ